MQSGQGHPVHEHMVGMHDVGGAAALESVDKGALPGRAGPVEGRQPDCLRQVEKLAPAAGRRQRDTAEVEVEIEFGIVLPHRRSDRQRGVNDALPEPGDDFYKPRVCRPKALPIRHPVQQLHYNTCPSTRRMPVRAPHQGIQFGQNRLAPPALEIGPQLFLIGHRLSLATRSLPT